MHDITTLSHLNLTHVYIVFLLEQRSMQCRQTPEFQNGKQKAKKKNDSFSGALQSCLDSTRSNFAFQADPFGEQGYNYGDAPQHNG